MTGEQTLIFVSLTCDESTDASDTAKLQIFFERC